MVSSVRAVAFEETTIADIHTAYRAGTLTAHAVTAACLARIAAYDKDGPYLNALITVNAQALAEADALDAAYTATPELLNLLKPDFEYDWNYPYRYGTGYAFESRIAYLYGTTLGGRSVEDLYVYPSVAPAGVP